MLKDGRRKPNRILKILRGFGSYICKQLCASHLQEESNTKAHLAPVLEQKVRASLRDSNRIYSCSVRREHSQIPMKTSATISTMNSIKLGGVWRTLYVTFVSSAFVVLGRAEGLVH